MCWRLYTWKDTHSMARDLSELKRNTNLLKYFELIMSRKKQNITVKSNKSKCPPNEMIE